MAGDRQNAARHMRDFRINVTLMHGSVTMIEARRAALIPLGHCLDSARLRHLARSDCMTVTVGTRAVGLAAYKKAESDVRVVHEFLLNRQLDESENEVVTRVMLDALEMLSHDDGIHCLIVVVGSGVSLVPFEQHRYTTLITDSGSAWLQKKFDSATWTVAASRHLQ